MARVAIYRIKPAKTYEIVNGDSDSDMHGFVHANGRTYMLLRQSLFAERKPIPLDSLDHIKSAATPLYQDAPSKYKLWVVGDNALPLSVRGFVPTRMMNDARAEILLTAVERAQSEVASDLQTSVMKPLIYLLMGVVALLTAIIAFIAVQEYFYERIDSGAGTSVEDHHLSPNPLPTEEQEQEASPAGQMDSTAKRHNPPDAEGLARLHPLYPLHLDRHRTYLPGGAPAAGAQGEQGRLGSFR